MLPAAARLTRSQEFSLVVRRGRRAGRRRLVVHALVGGAPDQVAGSQERHGVPAASPTRDSNRSPRVGFVVSKAVGGSVVRHRVTRQLRHLIRDRLAELPPGTDLVVRALPAAAGSTSAELAHDLDAALRRLGLVPAPEPAGTPADASSTPDRAGRSDAPQGSGAGVPAVCRSSAAEARPDNKGTQGAPADMCESTHNSSSVRSVASGIPQDAPVGNLDQGRERSPGEDLPPSGSAVSVAGDRTPGSRAVGSTGTTRLVPHDGQ